MVNVIIRKVRMKIFYCLTKISTWAKPSISCVFSLFIVPSPLFIHCPYKGHINWAKAILTSILASATLSKNGGKNGRFSQTINFSLWLVDFLSLQKPLTAS